MADALRHPDQVGDEQGQGGAHQDRWDPEESCGRERGRTEAERLGAPEQGREQGAP